MTWSGVLCFLGLLQLCNLPADATVQHGSGLPRSLQKELSQKKEKKKGKTRASIHALSCFTPLLRFTSGFSRLSWLPRGLEATTKLSALDDSGRGESCMD